MGANPLLGNGAVPDVMQVVVTPIPLNVNAVPSQRNILVMQRLVKVTDEVYHELDSLSPPPVWQLRVKQLLSVVSQRADDAPGLFAVALEIDVAVLGWAVVGVNEVEVLCETAPARVADGVGPSRHAGHVVVLIILEQVLEEGFGRVRDEVAGDEGGGNVPETCRSSDSVHSDGRCVHTSPGHSAWYGKKAHGQSAGQLHDVSREAEGASGGFGVDQEA